MVRPRRAVVLPAVVDVPNHALLVLAVIGLGIRVGAQPSHGLSLRFFNAGRAGLTQQGMENFAILRATETVAEPAAQVARADRCDRFDALIGCRRWNHVTARRA